MGLRDKKKKLFDLCVFRNETETFSPFRFHRDIETAAAKVAGHENQLIDAEQMEIVRS